MDEVDVFLYEKSAKESDSATSNSGSICSSDVSGNDILEKVVMEGMMGYEEGIMEEEPQGILWALYRYLLWVLLAWKSMSRLSDTAFGRLLIIIYSFICTMSSLVSTL